MTCENCNPSNNYPGRLVKVTTDLNHCAVCKEPINNSLLLITGMEVVSLETNWDTYFHTICIAVASKSPCLSRNIGALLVKDRSIVATGYNGPPRGVPHCGHERIIKDKVLSDLIVAPIPTRKMLTETCPRRVLGYESGTHMELCPAQHAEENAISNAARLGVSVIGSTLYMDTVIPCQKCFGTLINAGIVEIVVDKIDVYDKHTQFLIDNSDIKIRSFNL